MTKNKDERYDFPAIKKYGFFALCLTDSNGDIITGIEAGTTGNIDVYVHWMSNRNKTYPVKKLGEPQVIEDRENGQIFFVYEIGEIDNVPIETIHYVGEVDEELTHESTTVTVKNTATQNAASIAQTVANATTNSASMTLSDEWSTHYSIDEELVKTEDREQMETLKEYVENGGQWNISSQFGGETVHTDSFGSSSSSSHKSTTGKVVSSSNENGGGSENQASFKFESSVGVDAGITANIGTELSEYVKTDSEWKRSSGNEETSGTEDSNSNSSYSDISDSYSNSWNSEEGYTQSHNIGTETDISNALRTVITENSKKSYSDEYKESSLTTTSQDISHEEGREYSSAITFSTSEEVSTSTTTKQVFKTKGFYRYIRAGKLDVYAVVGYDIKNNAYSVSTFSMFENETHEMWDFSEDGTFTDGEIGVLPFEVPYEVEEYVLGQTAYTNGLEFNYAQGAVTRYVGTAKNVLIPNYYSKNGNMTYVKTLGIDPQTNKPLFAGNENIEVVRLSKYITSIPDGAFEGCTNLKTVIAPGVTSIGNNAFAGCENLNKFIVSTKVTYLGENAFTGCPEVVIDARNSSVARAATTAGANRITINVEEMSGVFTEKVLDDTDNLVADYTNGYTINIGDIEYFAFYGGGKTFENVKLISNAEVTYIENATFTSNNGISLNIDSENITFKGVNVKNDNVAMLSQFDGAKILIAEDSSFGALTDDKATKVITKNIELSNNSGETAQWMIDSTLYICGETEFTGDYIVDAETIEMITETEFENYKNGIFTIVFEPNGGEVSTASKTVIFGETYGNLPTPTRTHYSFLGWYTEIDDGIEITEGQTVDLTEDITLYAHWELNEFIVSFDADGGTISTPSKTVVYGEAYGELPVPTKDYYTFDGWFTEVDGGTEVTEETIYESTIDTTIYAHWTLNPTYGWILASEMPADAQIVNTKYTYTRTDYTTSSNSTLSGWTLYDTQFAYSDYGAWSAWSDSEYYSSELRNVKTQTVLSHYEQKTQYFYTRYYGWSSADGYYKATPYSSGICTTYQETGWLDSALAYEKVQYFAGVAYDAYGYKAIDNKAIYWYNPQTRLVDDNTKPVYKTQWSYQDRSKIYTYYFYQVHDNLESSTYPTGENISNIQEWVQYRAK